MVHTSVLVHISQCQRGIHDIEHQITYEGSNFIFHDSQGFESGATDELDVAWEFIDKKSVEPELRDQLHGIWYLGLLLLLFIITKCLIGTVSLWTVPVHFCIQNFNSFKKEQEKVSAEAIHLIS